METGEPDSVITNWLNPQNHSAFPTLEDCPQSCTGMSKRELVATALLSGMLSNSGIYAGGCRDHVPDSLVRISVNLADRLLKTLIEVEKTNETKTIS